MKKIILITLMFLLAFSMVISAADEILIGSIQDLSGPTSVWGNAVRKGAELAIEKINAEGGVNGKQLKLKTYDVKLKPQEAITAYNRLVNEGASIVLGPPISNIGLAISSIANANKVPVLGSFMDSRCTTKKDGSPQPYMFLMQPSCKQYAEILAGYALDKLNIKKVGILYDQSNAYVVSLVKPFKAYFEKHGGEIVAEETFKKGDKDYKTQLNNIKNSGAEALFFPNYVQSCVLAVQQANQIGLDVPVIGAFDLAPPFTSLMNEPSLADDMYFANNYSDKEPQLKAVHDSYLDKYDEEPINKAYLGYDKVLIAADAIDRAGSADPTAVKEALEGTSNLRCTTGNITISSETHRPTGLTMVIYKIEEGKYNEMGRYVPSEHKK